MTKEILQKAIHLNKDIELLKEGREQVKQYYHYSKTSKPTEKQTANFCDNMLNIIDELLRIKQKEFEEL